MNKKEASDPDLEPEYDFSGGVRGKHYDAYMAGTNVVVLDPDVAKLFPNSEAVNSALRALGSIIAEREQIVRPRRATKAKAKSS